MLYRLFGLFLNPQSQLSHIGSTPIQFKFFFFTGKGTLVTSIFFNIQKKFDPIRIATPVNNLVYIVGFLQYTICKYMVLMYMSICITPKYTMIKARA